MPIFSCYQPAGHEQTVHQIGMMNREGYGRFVPLALGSRGGHISFAAINARESPPLSDLNRPGRPAMLVVLDKLGELGDEPNRDRHFQRHIGWARGAILSLGEGTARTYAIGGILAGKCRRLLYVEASPYRFPFWLGLFATAPHRLPTLVVTPDDELCDSLPPSSAWRH